MGAINYFRRLYTTYGSDMLLSAAIYYFWRLYITFDSYILLLALPDCVFVRIQDFVTIYHTYGLKARLDFNINLLALIQFCFFCSSIVSQQILQNGNSKILINKEQRKLTLLPELLNKLK